MAIEIEIIRDLAIIMVIASAVTFLFHSLKQPIILGYLIAGIVIGPYTPPFALITHIDFLKIFAEFGIVLLLFVVGLEFPLSRLRKVGRIAIGVAALKITVLIGVGYLIGLAFNWSYFDSLFLAAALSISSTTIIVKVLEELDALKEESSTIMLGVLIMEDLAAVFMIAYLQSVATVGDFNVADIAIILGKSGLFIGGTLLVGSLIVPKLIDRIARPYNRELIIISAVGLCFGLAFVGNLLGFSVVIGAFMAGVLIAESKSSEAVARATLPLKEMFAALFFVSIGALMDVRQIPTLLIPAIITVLVSVAAKFLITSFGVRLLGYRGKTPIRVGLGMIQIGEFSFIIIKTGEDLSVVSPFLFPLVGMVAGVTILLTPYMIRYGMSLSKSSI